MKEESVHHLHEIFSSLQGEGRNMGRPATFIRYATCNLACPWCDTRKTEREVLSTQQVLAKVGQHSSRLVIITGGEPTVQPGLYELARALKGAGYTIALETNGLRALEDETLFDYVACSPKAFYEMRYQPATMLRRADEVRIVAEREHMSAFCQRMRQLIEAKDWYVSPLEEKGKIHYRRAYNLILHLNHQDPRAPWALSVQLHKILGIK